MDRAELEGLDRTTLIARAELVGVTRANILTRPELMDELLVRTARKDDQDLPRSRGFFGRARDLVARLIEKGLHLPDAADRFRQVSAAASQLASRVAPAVVPTVTLAEIYAAQGHRPRAIETLRRLLEIEPDHEAARALLTTLETPAVPDGQAVGRPAPVTPSPRVEEAPRSADPGGDLRPAEAEISAVAAPSRPFADAPTSARNVAASPTEALLAEARLAEPSLSEPSLAEASLAEPSLAEASLAEPSLAEPTGFLDDEPLPVRYDVDECVAIAVDPVTLYVYWEVRHSTFEHIRRTRGDEEGVLTLRLLIITPSWDGPRSVTRDFDVESDLADRVVRDLPAGAIVRAAIGWRVGDSFLPIAHAPALETPPGAPCPVVADALLRWTASGAAPVASTDADYASIGRALGHLTPRRQGIPVYGRLRAPLGSSEVSAGFATAFPGPRNGSLPAHAGNAPSSHALV